MSSFVEVKKLGYDVEKPRGFLARWWRKSGPGRAVLNDVSFSLNQGQWVTVYGGPGAGKTTLLSLLSGYAQPGRGSVTVNGKPPEDKAKLIGLSESGKGLSSTEQLQKKIEQAAASDVPLVLLDDVADQLGAEAVKRLLFEKFQNRTVIISTRFPAAAEELGLPILLLHGGTLACSGTCDEMALRVAIPRVLDAWIEGIRYDVFREIKKHPGVAQVLLIPDGRFNGQRLRITLKSARYMPSIYDLVSRVSVLRLEEVPAKLEDILARL